MDWCKQCIACYMNLTYEQPCTVVHSTIKLKQKKKIFLYVFDIPFEYGLEWFIFQRKNTV